MLKNIRPMKRLIQALKRGIWCCLLVSVPAAATDRVTAIADLHHTSWAAAEGLPGEVVALAQTTDGYIWILTTAGPYRFDGIRFEALTTACQCEHDDTTDIFIHAAKSGGLWIGSRTQISRLLDGQIHSYTLAPECELPMKIAEDMNGNEWVIGRDTVCMLKGAGKFEPISTPGRPAAQPNDIFCDSKGTVWIKNKNSMLYFRPQGDSQFHLSRSGSADVDKGYDVELTIAQTPDGRLWDSGYYGLRRIYEGSEDLDKRPVHFFAAKYLSTHKFDGLKPLSLLGTPETTGAILADREGSLWLAVKRGLIKVDASQPLVRNAYPGKSITTYTPEQGLTSDVVRAMLEDREGNIWVGTSSGLDRFSPDVFHKAPFPMKRQTQYAIGLGARGEILAGNFDTPLAKLDASGIHSFSSLQDAEIELIHRSPDHTIWVARFNEIWRMAGSTFEKVKLPERWPDSRAMAIADTKDGALWVSFSGHGIYRLSAGVWTNENPTLGIKPNVTAPAFGVDSEGTLWVAGTRTLTEYRDGQTHKYPLQDRPVDSRYLETFGKHIWLGGWQQLGLLVDRKVHVIRGKNGERFQWVGGLVELPTGDVWLNCVKGVGSIKAAEIQHAVMDPSYEVSVQTFNKSEGVEGFSDLTAPPTALLGDDGRIWVATNKGVFWIDPKELSKRAVAPPPDAVIQTISTTSEHHLALGNPWLSPSPANLEIHYTANSLALPEKLEFKYRLTGVDRDWQMAGTRRQAFYNKLAPGTYTFSVLATNPDGIWGTKPTQFSFRVLPAYYQTWWFRLLMIVCTLLVFCLLFRAQIERSKAEVRGRLSARLQERERIARELHDTLLQGFHGLMFRFQAVSEMLETPHIAAPVLNEALNKADALMIESRGRIRDLRYESEQVVPLPEALAAVAEQMSRDFPISFRAVVDGTVVSLNPLIREEMYLIGRESLLNAFHHSKGTAIEMEITFHPKWIRVRVRDDGQGIPAETLNAGGSAGHWGLSGMFERAEKMGSQLKVWNRSGSGCEVELVVPAKVAYQASRQRRLAGTLWSKIAVLRIAAIGGSGESDL